MSSSRSFRVLDQTTGREADLMAISTEGWVVDKLVYCDLEGWLVGDDGTLYLADECGAWAYPPPDRFVVEWAT